MAEVEKSIVLQLNEGVVEGLVTDSAQGVVTRSENTRLTKLKGTVSRRPALSTLYGTDFNTECSVIASGRGGSSIVLLPPESIARRVVGDAVETVKSTVTGLPGQNGYRAIEMIEGATVAGGTMSETPAVCFDSEGRHWVAAVRQSTDSKFGVYVSVYDGATVLVSTREVYNISIVSGDFQMSYWVGIVRRTGGVALFFEKPDGIYAANMSISAGVISTGFPTLIVTPIQPTGAPLKPRFACVTSDNANTAFLLTRSNSSLTDAFITKVNLTTLVASAGTTFVGATSDHQNAVYFAIQHYVGTNQILYAISDPQGFYETRFGVLDAAGFPVWDDIAFQEYGAVAVQPITVAGVLMFTLASTSMTDFPFTGNTYITFRHRVLSDGSVNAVPNRNVYWYRLQSRGAHRIGPSGTEAFFPCMPCWGEASMYALPGDGDYIIDPSIEVLAFGGPPAVPVYTPIARFGVDRASMRVQQRNSDPTAMSVDGKRMVCCYAEVRQDVPALAAFTPILPRAEAARYVVLNTAPTFTAVAQADDNVSYIGAANPATWDGVEIADAGFLHRVRIGCEDTSGGLGPNINGTHSFVAVPSFRDAAGNIRRGAPSLPITISGEANKPVIQVTIPYTMRSGFSQERCEVVLYGTLENGSIFYALPALVRPKWDSGTPAGHIEFTYVAQPSAQYPQLYSDGSGSQNLLPEGPPPAWDIKAINSRQWIINAEERNTVLPSLLKQEGDIAYEWNGSLAISGFDAQYGKLVALADLNAVIVLAERAIWRVSGYGPNNAGQGDVFNEPELVSYVGCRSRESVVTLPGIGVLFQANDGYMGLFTGGALKKYDMFGVYNIGVPTVHIQENEVIYPLRGGSGFIVYNWLADGWTHWPTETRIFSAVGTQIEYSRTRTLLFEPSDGSIYTLDSDTVDPRPDNPMVVERAWIAPAQAQGDCCFKEMWLHAIAPSVQTGVIVRVSFDYDDTNFVEREWSIAEIDALRVDGRVTLGLNCHAKHARAFKVLITMRSEAPGEGYLGESIQPITMTVTYGAFSGLIRRKLREGALK